MSIQLVSNDKKEICGVSNSSHNRTRRRGSIWNHDPWSLAVIKTRLCICRNRNRKRKNDYATKNKIVLAKSEIVILFSMFAYVAKLGYLGMMDSIQLVLDLLQALSLRLG